MPPCKEALNEDGSGVRPDSRPISALTKWTNWTNIFGMKTVNVHEAKTNFSSLLATVEDSGRSFVICRNGLVFYRRWPARAGRRCPESSGRLRPFGGGQRLNRVVADFDFAQRGIRLDPARPPMRHQVGDGFTVATDDKRFAAILDRGEQAGEIRLCFMDIYRLHAGDVSPVSPVCQRLR